MMSIRTDQLTSILRAAVDGKSLPDVDSRLAALVDSLDIADGKFDGEIADYSTDSSLSGGVEQQVRAIFSEATASKVRNALEREVRRFIPMRCGVQDPRRQQITPAPSEALSDIFALMDEQGLYASTRDNGRYDLLDQPLAVVANSIKVLSDNGYVFNDDEHSFLATVLGLDTTQWIFDTAITKQWPTRWAFTGEARSFDPAAIDQATVDVIFDKGVPTPTDERVAQVKQLFVEVFKKVAKAAELQPTELPRQIIFTENPAIAVSATGHSEVTGFPPDLQALIPSCHDATEIIGKVLNDDEPTVFVASAAQLATFNRVKEQFDRVVTGPRDTGRMAMMIQMQWYTMLDGFVAQYGATDPHVSATMSAIAFLFAHEVGHVLDMRQHGLRAEKQVAAMMENTIAADMSALLPTFGYCPLLGVGTSFFDLWRKKMLSIIISSDTKQKIADIFHQREFDASHLGYYIAARAGYEPAVFSSFLLADQTQPTIDHPSEADHKKFIEALVQQGKMSGW